MFKTFKTTIKNNSLKNTYIDNLAFKLKIAVT